MKLIWFFCMLFTLSLMAQKGNTPLPNSQNKDQVLDEPSISEWKKFKRFELKLTEPAEENSTQRLSGYVRDSLQILGVKLMAIKLLDEKHLLDKDISENPSFYVSLLGELRESGIPPKEYRFLEERMAFLNQGVLEKQLGQSRLLNTGLLITCMGLVFLIVYFRITSKKSSTPELSRQEVNIRNLIVQGKSNKEIADELFISLSTVKSHITNLYAKLNVTNRQQLLKNGTGTST